MTNCPVSWKNESFRTPDPMDDWLPLFLFLASYTSQSQVTFLVSFSSLFAAFFSVSPLLSFFSILIHFLHIWAVTECEQKKKREEEKRERAHTWAATNYSVKAMVIFARRERVGVCSYISKCRMKKKKRRQRRWLTSYDLFNEYEQNHTFINFKMTVLMSTVYVWCWLFIS